MIKIFIFAAAITLTAGLNAEENRHADVHAHGINNAKVVLENRKLFVLSFGKFGLPIYYNILYICTLEILPLVVLMKLLVGKM